jgi:2-dehydro-3-deoxy-D-arabinonate dehydratase
MSAHNTTVYRTAAGIVVYQELKYSLLREKSWDEIFAAEDPIEWVRQSLAAATPCDPPRELLAPIGTQEVWAAGVTYLRSRDARMEESRESGGETFYDRVYTAERPEIFFKATAHRVVAPGGSMKLRSDADWNVPEPELTLAINSAGKIIGYTVGNDLSSRDIEGENPLYLPQAKIWSHCCALGPGIVLRDALPLETVIRLQIEREQNQVFLGETSLAKMKRSPEELRDWLWRDNLFPAGAYLMTGTGTVPPEGFTLQSGDLIRIYIEGLGELLNTIA